MTIINKINSTILGLSFLFACNFCVVECAFASEEHHHEGHSQSDKHDAGSLCCSSLVAIQNYSSDSTDIKFVKDSFFKTTVFKKFIPRPTLQPVYKFEFPPGPSPPEVFVLTHFTHAPPVSL